jgi:predicted enzyme involved in methoxymalonyl-ACP biosynthesis
MISVVICRHEGTDAWLRAWTIDTWLMSCRVLGRGVERMVLRELLQHAKQRGIDRLIGIYRPTERNAMVRDHYQGLGFRRISEAPNKETVWELGIDARVEEAPMRVRRLNFAAPAPVGDLVE